MAGRGSPCTAPARSAWTRSPAADWLAVGDAAATVDPLSSQGILKALRGGIFASYAIGDRLRGDTGALARYARWVAAEHDGDGVARATVYGRERRWADAPFWRRRLTLRTLIWAIMPPSSWSRMWQCRT